MENLGIHDDLRIDSGRGRGPQAVALACTMVGGGSDGSVDLCARVCLVDEHENIIFHAYVKPNTTITNYRFETTGIRAEHLRDAMPLRQAQRKVQDFMCNGELVWKIRATGKSRILAGHGLDHILECMGMEYPTVMIRYDIHNGIQDLYEDCVATMRLYIRMRTQNHTAESYPQASDPQNRNNFASWRESELQNMTPDELFEISRSDFYCWCLDSKGYA
ncbi:RNA exonuclease 4-like protein [Drosera capensis]